MARMAELPDGTQLEFPDDTTDAVIQSTVKRLLGVAPPAEPTTRPGAVERGVRGIAKGLTDPRDAMSQVLMRGAAAVGVPGTKFAADWWDADIKAREAAYKRDVRGGQSDLDIGRAVGNMVATSPLSAGMAPAGMGQAVLMGGTTGALSGLMQPVTQGDDFAAEKAKQVGLGALVGGATAPVGHGLSRMIQPKVSPDVAKLRAEGITPTPGQIMGGAFKSAEDKLTATPITGGAIKSGMVRANEQFNAAAVNRALKPINDKLPKGVIGSEAIEYADDALGAAYRDALDAVGPLKLDRQMSSALDAIKGRIGVLPKDKGEQFARVLQIEIGDRAKNGVLTPEAMKAAESNLGRMAREYGRQADFDTRQLGEAIGDAVDALRDMVQRQAPKGAADAVKAANTGWANFKRVQRAATYVGADDGVFTPAQLHSAVKAMDPSKDKGAFAKGSALMQDLSKAGKSVMTSKIPNSGTPERAAILGALNPMTWPYIAATLPATAAYTRPGQAAMAGLLAGRQGPVAGLLSEATRDAAVPLGMALTPAMYGLLNQ